jgi:hypothetical protein
VWATFYFESVRFKPDYAESRIRPDPQRVAVIKPLMNRSLKNGLQMYLRFPSSAIRSIATPTQQQPITFIYQCKPTLVAPSSGPPFLKVP